MRKGIGKRQRFEIFKRDAFTCQYCGNHPPHVVLEVDHIIAVAEGGLNDDDNLVTSCRPCNRGKSHIPLSSVPQSLREKAEELAELEAQIKGYSDTLQKRRDRLEDDAWRVAVMLNPKADSEGFKRDWLRSIRNFVEKLGVHETIDAMEIAAIKMPWSEKRAFSYFCGICWKKIKESDHARS